MEAHKMVSAWHARVGDISNRENLKIGFNFKKLIIELDILNRTTRWKKLIVNYRGAVSITTLLTTHIYLFTPNLRCLLEEEKCLVIYLMYLFTKLWFKFVIY